MLINTDTTCYAVVAEGTDMIQCIAMTDDLDMAIGKAYQYACDLAGDDGVVSTLRDLEMDTGLGVTVKYGNNNELNEEIYILCLEPKPKQER